MIIKTINQCKEIIAGDGTKLREVINSHNDETSVSYSLAQAVLDPGEKSIPHKLKSNEVYVILSGEGEIHVGEESEMVSAGQAVLIPHGLIQYLINTGKEDLVFLCIVDPAWKKEDEQIII